MPLGSSRWAGAMRIVLATVVAPRRASIGRRQVIGISTGLSARAGRHSARYRTFALSCRSPQFSDRPFPLHGGRTDVVSCYASPRSMVMLAFRRLLVGCQAATIAHGDDRYHFATGPTRARHNVHRSTVRGSPAQMTSTVHRA
jgi:hypothetical protein